MLLISINSRIIPSNIQENESIFENIEQNLINEIFDDYENFVNSDEIEYKEVDPRLKNSESFEETDLMKKLPIKNQSMKVLL